MTQENEKKLDIKCTIILLLKKKEISIEEFARIISSSGRYIDRSELCREFGISRSTLGRWESGESAPQGFARPIVLRWIKEALEVGANEKVKFVRDVSLALESGEGISRKEFAYYIQTASRWICVDDFCDSFGVDRSTIARWKESKSAPQSYIRPLVIVWARAKTRDFVPEKLS